MNALARLTTYNCPLRLRRLCRCLNLVHNPVLSLGSGHSQLGTRCALNLRTKSGVEKTFFRSDILDISDISEISDMERSVEKDVFLLGHLGHLGHAPHQTRAR
jgi:hypothetical protein